jgi:hypothetical protein
LQHRREFGEPLASRNYVLFVIARQFRAAAIASAHLASEGLSSRR